MTDQSAAPAKRGPGRPRKVQPQPEQPPVVAEQGTRPDDAEPGEQQGPDGMEPVRTITDAQLESVTITGGGELVTAVASSGRTVFMTGQADLGPLTADTPDATQIKTVEQVAEQFGIPNHKAAPLLVIVPARGRPDQLAYLLRAWVETDAVGTADLRVDLDADDPELPGYRALATELPDWATFAVGDEYRPPLRKLNRAARQSTDYFALGFMAEGYVPLSTGWAQAYVAELRRLGTGVVYGDDGFQGSGPGDEWAMTSDIVTALQGRMVPARVDHLYAGAAVMELGRAIGRISYLDSVQLALGPTGQALDKEQARRDRNAWLFWQRTGLVRDAQAVLSVALPQQ